MPRLRSKEIPGKFPFIVNSGQEYHAGFVVA